MAQELAPLPKANIQQDIDYTKILKIVLSRWYWVASTLVIALLAAYIYLWYTPPLYATGASLKFEEKRSEISELLNVRNVYDRTNKIASETFVISSREVLTRAANNLRYDVSYYLKGRIRTKDLYPLQPFAVEIIDRDTSAFYQQPIEFTAKNTTDFELEYVLGGTEIKKQYRFGQVISLPNVKFKINNSVQNPIPQDVTYIFSFNSKAGLMGRIAGGLSMGENKNTNILNLSQTDGNPVFARDALNAVIISYVKYDRNQRSQSANQTINFIDTLLSGMEDVVKKSGKDIKDFKVSNQLFDVSTGSQKVMADITGLETQKRELSLQSVMIDQLQKDIVNNQAEYPINFNLQGITDAQMSGLVGQFNTLVEDRNKGLESYKPSSEFIKQLDNKILEIKAAFVNNVKAQKEKNAKTKAFLDQQIAIAKQGFNVLPEAERNYINLQSTFDINQKVYQFLSEKKLEAQISKAAVTPGSVIVDTASFNPFPISPISRKIYTFAIAAGLLAGIGLIFLVRLLNPYIYDKETIESLTTIPIIGIIRKFPDEVDENSREILSIKNPKSLFAESVRSVRTNLSYLASEKQNKVVCITSEISGEGKSFTTVNLASTLSLIDKKVIIIAADLRKSKLHKTFKVDNLKGLSSYLSGQMPIEQVLIRTGVDNLDFIPSGPVPPNPSELLYSEKMRQLVIELEKTYDFVIIDSAPVGLVSDATPLIRMADINLFVIRSGVSRYHAATVPERLGKEFNLNNIAIILNAFDNDILHSRYYSTNYSGSYYANYYYYSDYSGYGGGYYNEEGKNKWWAFWKRK